MPCGVLDVPWGMDTIFLGGNLDCAMRANLPHATIHTLWHAGRSMAVVCARRGSHAVWGARRPPGRRRFPLHGSSATFIIKSFKGAAFSKAHPVACWVQHGHSLRQVWQPCHAECWTSPRALALPLACLLQIQGWAVHSLDPILPLTQHLQRAICQALS